MLGGCRTLGDSEQHTRQDCSTASVSNLTLTLLRCEHCAADRQWVRQGSLHEIDPTKHPRRNSTAASACIKALKKESRTPRHPTSAHGTQVRHAPLRLPLLRQGAARRQTVGRAHLHQPCLKLFVQHPQLSGTALFELALRVFSRGAGRGGG